MIRHKERKREITNIAYVFGNHLMLLSISNHCPVYGQIPSTDAFELISENCKRQNNTDNEREEDCDSYRDKRHD